jgi:hypothetical protein
MGFGGTRSVALITERYGSGDQSFTGVPKGVDGHRACCTISGISSGDATLARPLLVSDSNASAYDRSQKIDSRPIAAASIITEEFSVMCRSHEYKEARSGSAGSLIST